MRFINTSDLMPPDWRFLASVSEDPDIIWETFSGQPRGGLERAVRRPNLARWRAALEAARAAQVGRPAVLVSHLPLMSAAGNVMRRILCPSVPQVAFAFNFTDLPQGPRRAFLTRALTGIEEFVVFSRFEQSLYAETFNIDPARIRFLPWAMEAPEPGQESPLPETLRRVGYLAAIGGEGRDYALLADVMRARPALRAVIVARPYSIAGVEFPDNVTVFTNLPGSQTWRIAVEARALVIPLKTDQTACGHITMVGAQLLGIPLIVTRSRGVADYVDADSAQMVPAGDAAALRAAFDRVGDDTAGLTRLAENGRARAATDSTLLSWIAYFSNLAGRFAL